MQRHLTGLLFSISTLLPFSAFPAGPPVTLSLYPQYGKLRPGSRTGLALLFRLPAGWHAYWRNPGDSGMAPSVEWKLPPGVRISGPRWPVPRIIAGPEGITFGYEGDFSLIYTVHLSPRIKVGARLPITGQVSWLLCRESCVPGEGRVRITLQAGSGGKPDFRFRHKLQYLPGSTTGTSAVFRETGGFVFLEVAVSERPSYFFPHDGNLFTTPRSLVWTRTPHGWRTRLEKTATWRRPAGMITGVLVFSASNRAHRARMIKGRIR